MSAESSLLRAELRGETRLYVLAAVTTAFAAAALTLVLALSDIFERSFSSSARTLLGGDVSVRLRARDFTPEEFAWLRENSAEISFIRVAAVMALAEERAQMTRVKVADAAYPLYGELRLQSGGDLQTLLAAPAAEDGAYPAAVAADFLELADLQIGDTFSAAGLTMRIADVVVAEPDPDSRMWMAVPLILVGESAAAGGHFSAAGMLSSRFARVRLPDGGDAEEWTARLESAFPEAGWNVRGAARAMPGLRRFVDRMRSFLAIMSLAAMLTAGIGVGGATSAFLRARMRAIAVVKMLGGNAALIARVYLKIAALFIFVGALAGALAGGALSYWAAPHLSAALPLPLSPEWSWAAFFKAIFVAAATGAAFSVLPVLRAGKINPLTLFNAESGDSAPPYSRRDILIAAAVWIPALLFLPLEWREKIAAFAIAAAALLLYAISAACAGAAGTAARRLPPPVSWGLFAIARNRRQTASGVVALGVGMALLVAILNIEGNFSARIDDTLRREAPTFYLTGARTEQRDALAETLTATSAESRLRTIPFLRGKIVALGGREADDIETSPDFRWILRNDRALTWTENGEYIGASKVTRGALWDETETRPQVSFDREAAEEFGLEIGDDLVLNILGQRLTTVITSFRDIDWQSFDINFVVILDRRPFGDAPYSLMGAAFLPPEDENRAKLAIVREFPNITPIAMSAVFEIGRRLLTNVSLLLQAAALFMLLGAAPVVAASLMDGQRRRVRDAVTLRLLGAPTGVLIVKGMAEFAAMAAAALLPAIVFGLVAAKLVVEHIFDLQWNIGDGSPLIVAFGGALLFLIFGCAGVAKWVRHPPLAVIRND